jgi:hypothetical protein
MQSTFNHPPPYLPGSPTHPQQNMHPPWRIYCTVINISSMYVCMYVCMYVNLATDFYIYKVEAYVLRCRHLTQNCFGNSVPSWMLNAAVLVLLIPLFYSKYRNENRTFWRGPRSMTKDFVRFFLQSCCIVPLDVLTKAYIGGVKCNSNHQT